MAGFWGARKQERAQREAADAELGRRADAALVAADERLRTTADELLFAELELGRDATRDLRDALDKLDMLIATAESVGGQAIAVFDPRGADGPERIFGEWWLCDPELAAVRDYFRVEDDAGDRYWIYRAGDGEDARTGSHRWFLHGVFG